MFGCSFKWRAPFSIQSILNIRASPLLVQNMAIVFYFFFVLSQTMYLFVELFAPSLALQVGEWGLNYQQQQQQQNSLS